MTTIQHEGLSMSEMAQHEALARLICDTITLHYGWSPMPPTTLSYALGEALSPFVEQAKAGALRDAAGIARSVHDRDWSHEQKIAISIVWKEIGDYADAIEKGTDR